MHPTLIEMIAEERQVELRRVAMSPRDAALSNPARRPARRSGERLGRLRRQLTSLVSPDPSTQATGAQTNAQACCA